MGKVSTLFAQDYGSFQSHMLIINVIFATKQPLPILQFVKE